jgi:CDP-4-dehydro-6-deoxyglucose reductase
MKIRLLPNHIEFDQLPNASLLDSALRAGVALPHGCANGACGLCKARKVDGDVVKLRAHDATLTSIERSQGVLLLCSYAAASDVLLEEIADPAAGVIEHQRIEARVRKVETLNDATLLLHLRTPRSTTFHYRAGHRALLTMSGGAARELPVASCPCDPMNLQFHVHADGDGDFFAAVRGARPSDVVTIAGPEGDFTFRESDGRRLVFVAHEHGFAPIKSLLEHALSLELPQRVDLAWFAAEPNGHYLDNYCRALADALDNVRYLPAAIPAAALQSADIEAALRPVLDACGQCDDADVYVAGPAHFIDVARDMFVARGLPGTRYFSEAR